MDILHGVFPAQAEESEKGACSQGKSVGFFKTKLLAIQRRISARTRRRDSEFRCRDLTTCTALSNKPGPASSRYHVKINAFPLMLVKCSSPAAIYYLGRVVAHPSLAKGIQEGACDDCGVMAQA
jgi:hypothetical protein